MNKSLDAAQDALGALRKDVGRDASAGARDAYKNLQKFVKDARRGSGKLGKTLERDLQRLQKEVVSAARGRSTRATASRRTSGARKTTARRSSTTRGRSASARRATGRSTARRTTRASSRSRSGSRSRAR